MGERFKTEHVGPYTLVENRLIAECAPISILGSDGDVICAVAGDTDPDLPASNATWDTARRIARGLIATA